MTTQDSAYELRRGGQGRWAGRRKLLPFIVVALAAAMAIVLLLSGRGGPGQERLDVTIKELEAAVLADPQNADARIALASVYSARGLYANAVAQFQEALTLRPEDQAALIGLGLAYLRKGELDAALEPLLRVAEINKDNPRRHSIEQLGTVYYSLGRIYFEKGDLEQAAAQVRESLAVRRMDADSWYLLGQVQERAGQWGEAVAAYSNAVRFVPDFVDAYRGLERSYQRQGLKGEQAYARGMIRLAESSFNEAIKDLRQAVELSPSLAVAHQGLAMAYESAGKKAEALASYRQASALDPDLMLARLGVQRLEGR